MYKININNLKVKTFENYEDAYTEYKRLRKHLDEDTVKCVSFDDVDYYDAKMYNSDEYNRHLNSLINNEYKESKNERIKHTYDVITRSSYDNSVINITKKYMSRIDALESIKEYHDNSVYFELLKRNHTLLHYKKIKSLDSFVKREFKKYFNDVVVVKCDNTINVMLDDTYKIRISTHTLDERKYTANEITVYLEIALVSFKIERNKISNLIKEVALLLQKKGDDINEL